MKKAFPQSPERQQLLHSELELIDDIRGGNRARFEAAWGELYKRYADRVAVGMSGRVPDRATAEEIVQQAFVKAATNIETFERGSSFYTWIYRIALNLTIDLHRKVTRHRTDSLDDEAVQDRGAVASDQSPSAQRALEQRETNARVQAAIAQLSPDQAEVLRLYELDGLSYKEIADHQGVPEGTVMSRLFYARKKLREILQREPASPVVRKQNGEEAPKKKLVDIAPADAATDEETIRQLREFIARELAESSRERQVAEDRVQQARKNLEEISQ